MFGVRRPVAITVACIVVGSLVAACAASPRQRPIKMGPVDTGAGSLEGTRRQLQGRWTLLSFETYPSPGEVVQHKAAGELIYDEYGNLQIRGSLEGREAGTDSSVLRYSGRAVIDAANSRLVLQDLKGQGGEALPGGVTPDKVRYYEFVGDLLKIAVKDASGRPTASVTWKRAE